jgi:phosphatidylglycerophosphate synthase
MFHFARRSPDWQKISPTKRNRWQLWAAQSGGVITPANAVSVLGLALVIAGLALIGTRSYWWGLSMVAVGRLCDVLDGYVADATGTKGPVGEMVDVVCDKVGAFLALVVLMVTGIVWWPIAVALGLYNVANSVIGLLSKRRKLVIHPSKAGKFSTALQWLALVGLLLAAAWGWPASSVWSVCMYGVAIAGLALGLFAARSYLRLLTAPH